MERIQNNQGSPEDPASRNRTQAFILKLWHAAELEPTSKGEPPPLSPPPDAGVPVLEDDGDEVPNNGWSVDEGKDVIRFVGGPTVVSITATCVVVASALAVLDDVFRVDWLGAALMSGSVLEEVLDAAVGFAMSESDVDVPACSAKVIVP